MAYFTIITTTGLNKLALADSGLGPAVSLTEIAAGDALGTPYDPTGGETGLVNENWRANLTSLSTHPDHPNWIVAEGVIPYNVGGWYIREVGIFDSAGDLILIGNYPETLKPVLSAGVGTDLKLKVVMPVTNTSSVTLTVDPSVTLASQEYVNGLVTKSLRKSWFYAQS